MIRKYLIFCGLLVGTILEIAVAQSKHWQDNDRVLHYTEDKGDFLLVNGRYRFNRALYGNNLASRVEVGDLPEFALYMPGMAGNLQFVLSNKQQRKKVIDADHIETRYRPGAMYYRIKDALLGNGYIDIVVMAQADAEGMIVKLQAANIKPDAHLYAVYGGASGKTFSRNGDIGADPESGFYLLPGYCEHNQYTLEKNSFGLKYQNKKNEPQFIQGSFSGLSALRMSDATVLDDLSNLTKTENKGSPILVGKFMLTKKSSYIQIAKGKRSAAEFSEGSLEKIYELADQKRVSLASRVKINTPDRYINNLGAALSAAADGIWESPTFLHGAVAWRMRLNAWRGAYTADVLGWHDRAKEHFSSYANSQVSEPAAGRVVMDTTLHLARHLEKMGTSMFSSGYISRNPNNNTVPHHYDMNLVFIDQLLSHFNYTGDVAYIKEMWPTLTRHLNWEKRNFDQDNDGLYDAYCAIWASDGLQYSGGAVTHTTAYMYRANQIIAKLAKVIGEDATPYQQEANKIQKALKDRLWLQKKGHFAEFQDALGNQLIHENAGLWTIYHTADAAILDDFESYQNLQYVTNYLPKIPIHIKGQEQHDLYTLPTTTWQPYTWSVNNVALAENLQTALAYWQSGRADDAYQLWKSNLMESMYHGISPANFQQLSHYDAFRGELYRDFADPIGVASRTLVEGLFGVHPRLLDKQLFLKPGFPSTWNFAQIEMPEWSYTYKKTKTAITFQINTRYAMPVKLALEVPVDFTQVSAVKVNGKEVKWSLKSSAINGACIVVESEAERNFDITIMGDGKLEKMDTKNVEQVFTDQWAFPLPANTQLLESYDPQGIIQKKAGHKFSFVQHERVGTFFVKLQQGAMVWWQAVDIRLLPPVNSTILRKERNYFLTMENRSAQPQQLAIVHQDFQTAFSLRSGEIKKLELPINSFSKGTNSVNLVVGTYRQTVDYIDWNIDDKPDFLAENLSSYYNARLTDIFQQKYLSPRSEGPTLQLPWQGIGNWCYPLTTANIDDRGIMKKGKQGDLIYLGIPFQLKNDSKNVVFVSQWDNYPKSVKIPLAGQASKMYLLVAGSTNPMQSQLINAKIKVNYTDGTFDTLDLINPINWWPIEQDYLDDNHAFELPDERVPYRISLKSGELYKGGTWSHYTDIKGYSNRAIDGGAASLLDLPLNNKKKLQSVELIAVANDAVIGLIGLTLMR
jgi:hypothetical protein